MSAEQNNQSELINTNSQSTSISNTPSGPATNLPAVVQPPVYTPASIIIYTIQPVHNIKYSHEVIRNFIQSLTSSFPRLLFQIVGRYDGVVWQIVDTMDLYPPENLITHIRSFYPGTEVNVQTYSPQILSAGQFRYVTMYKQQNIFPAPLQYITDFKQSDPLSAIAEALNNLQRGEQLVYAIGLFGYAQDAYKKGERLITKSPISGTEYMSVRGLVYVLSGVDILPNARRIPKYQQQDQKILEEKLRDILHYGIIMVQADATSPERVIELLGRIEIPLDQFTKVPYNNLQWIQDPLNPYHVTPELDFLNSTIGFHSIVREPFTKPQQDRISVFSIAELSALWHLPSDKTLATNVQYAESNMVKVPGQLARAAETDIPADSVYIGEGKYQDRAVTVHIPLEDRRLHTNIIGKTGMGKSNLLHHLIHQDIHQGRGVAVIDPHGTLVKSILRSSIPDNRLDDVVVLDLQNTEYPPPINPMRGANSYTEIGLIVNVLNRLFEGTNQQVQISRYLRAGIALLQQDESPTMRDLSRIFTDNAYRYKLWDQTDNPFAEDVWEQFEELSDGQKIQVYDPILSRLSHFYGNPALYPILCHPRPLPLKDWIRQKKIILISLALSEEVAAEQERNLIGTLIVSLLQMSGMNDKSTPFFIYIDEVQKFVTTSLDIVLSEARKFGLALTIANQFLGQLEGKTLKAVMGNVGTTIAFRCSPQDASALGPFMQPHFAAENLVGLDRFKAAIKMQSNGLSQPAFTVQTPEPLPESSQAEVREEQIRRRSVELYTPMTQAEILEWLRARYPKRRKNNPLANTTSDNAALDDSSFYE